MTKPLTLGSLLLLTTALIAPSALAQTSPPPTSSTSAPATGEAPPTADEADDPEEEVEISSPGGDDVDTGEEIVVTGRFIPEPIRNTPEVVSVLSAADIARTGEGDISGALQRVTGLSVVGNGFVYVRGLGDRYSLALLNGSPLPSPEPLKRVVPLDIFPTSVIASAVVQKSYSVNYPGEFGGGVINLTTKSIPDEGFFSFGGSVGGDTETTFQLGYTYFGSDSDFTGFDDGARDVPRPLQAAFDSGNLINEGANFTRADIENITMSLANANTTLLQRNDNIPANFSGNFTFGESFEAGADGRFGIIATAGINNGWRTRDAIQQSSLAPDLSGTLARDFRTVLTDNRIVVNGLVGLGYEFGDQKIRFTNLFIRDTIKQGRLSRGFDTTSLDTEIITQNTFWFERQLFESQLVGEFKFDDLSVDLRGTYANSQREAPYERSFSYAFDSGLGDFVNDLTSAGQSARVAFSDLNEDLYYGGIDLTYRLPTSIEAKVSAGYAYNKTERNSTRREFRFLPGIPLGAARQLRPDFLLSDVSVQVFDIGLVETSGQSGVAAFDAELEIHGGYVQAEATVTEGVSIAAGVRYETADQSVIPIDLFGTGGGSISTLLSNDYFLPAATVTWNFAENMQLRFAASKTIARPQFRELAFQLYQDPDSDRQFFGNPFLEDSELTNAEARYEWYFDRGQRLIVAGFYKKIDNPIETFGFFAGGNTLQTSFANAPEATLYGAELEVQKYVALDTLSDSDFFLNRRLVLIGNYTYTKSELKVGAGDMTIFPLGNGDPIGADTLFTDGDPLTGQSDHIVNLQIGLEDTEKLSQQTILLNYASERVTNRGPNAGSGRQPDIVEKPGFRLDFVARQGFTVLNKEFELKFEARNITNQKFEEFQRIGDSRVDINTYDVGTSLSLGLEVKL